MTTGSFSSLQRIAQPKTALPHSTGGYLQSSLPDNIFFMPVASYPQIFLTLISTPLASGVNSRF